ncbi:MAG: hypothetical protein C5B49_05580 [Bdellovibrio sp.]|nr:MAG: hypothetical protein C5B49_05580 [Bdellovibrio sp.]
MKGILRFLLSFCATGGWACYGQNICHVSSKIDDVLPSAQDLSTRYSGFQFAIEEYNKGAKRQANFIIIAPETKKDQVPELIQTAKSKDCAVIVGLITSKDALLAGPFLKQNEIPGFSSTAMAPDAQTFFPYLLSATTSSESWAKALLGDLRQHERQQIIIFRKASDFFSQVTVKSLEQEARNLDMVKQVQTVEVSSPDEMRTTLDRFKFKNVTFVFTTYPMASVEGISALSSVTWGRESKIYGNPSWMEQQTFLHFRPIMEKVPSIFLVAPWFPEDNTKENLDFQKKYSERFHAFPDHDTAYNYDVTKIILHCFEKNLRPVDCFKSPLHYDGVTGTFDFDGRSSHPLRSERIKKANYSAGRL